MFFRKTETLAWFYNTFKNTFKSGKLDELARLIQTNLFVWLIEDKLSISVINDTIYLNLYYVNNEGEESNLTLSDISQIIESNFDTYYDDDEAEKDFYIEEIILMAARKWYYLKEYSNGRYSFLNSKLVICNYNEEEAIDEFLNYDN